MRALVTGNGVPQDVYAAIRRGNFADDNRHAGRLPGAIWAEET